MNGQFIANISNKMSSSHAIALICWCIWHEQIDSDLLDLVRIQADKGVLFPGTPKYDLLSCLVNFTGDIDDPEDVAALIQTARPLVEEVYECLQ